MERKFYTDNFEQLLKEKSDEFRMYPSKRVWHSIYNDLHPGRKWPSVAVSLSLIIALLMVGYWNNKSNPVTIAGASQKNIPATTQSSGTYSTANITAPKSNTAAGSTNTSLVAQTQEHHASNSAPGSAAGQNEIFAANNTTAGKSPVSLNAAVQNTNPAQSTGAQSNQIIIAPSNNDKINIENGIVYSNLQNHVPGSSNDADYNEKPDAGKANATATISNSSFTAITVITPSLQRQEAKANVSAAISGASIVAPGEDVALHTSVNNEEETVTSTGGVDNNKTAKVELNTNNNGTAAPASNSITGKEETTAVNKNNKPSAKSSSAYKKITSTQDKEWIEDYAFRNKSKRKDWQDRTSFEFYITPNVVYSKISNEEKYNLQASSPSFANGGNFGDANHAIHKRPGLGIEAGFSINYSLAKNIVVKAGIQTNYTSYGINADETNHPILTTLTLLDPNSGYPYMHSALTTLSNISGSQPVVLHNKTYQVSIPLGFAFKVSGNSKLAWYTGATIQPTFVAGGKAYLISADRNNFVADPSLIRKWNLNTGIETYISYKFDGFTLQAGPQFRYQLLSTYYNQYTVNENLSNLGIKIGVVKNF